MSAHAAKSSAPGVSRRWVLRGLLAGGALALGGGVVWLGGGRGTLLSATRATMGTTATILVRTRHRARAEAAVAAAFERMEAVAALMTRFETQSDIGRVNARSGVWAPVDARTGHVVRAALAYARASDGAFDPALDRLTTLWGFHAPAGARHVPAAQQLTPWRGQALYRAVEMDGPAGAPRIRLTDPAAGLDLGGIAKGFAVDEAVAALREQGIRDAIVEAGGDLYAMGHAPEGGGWPVGVRHPRDPARLLATLHLSDEAAATSGDYVQYFQAGGRRYSHLMEPRRAAPADYLHAITVRAGRALAADALATAACALPPERGAPLLRRLEARGWLAMDHAGQLLHG